MARIFDFFADIAIFFEFVYQVCRKLIGVAAVVFVVLSLVVNRFRLSPAQMPMVLVVLFGMLIVGALMGSLSVYSNHIVIFNGALAGAASCICVSMVGIYALGIRSILWFLGI